MSTAESFRRWKKLAIKRGKLLTGQQPEHAKLRSLLQQMLNVAENCDETGYIDGVGFVDVKKLHRKVRAALK